MCVGTAYRAQCEAYCSPGAIPTGGGGAGLEGFSTEWGIWKEPRVHILDPGVNLAYLKPGVNLALVEPGANLAYSEL